MVFVLSILVHFLGLIFFCRSAGARAGWRNVLVLGAGGILAPRGYAAPRPSQSSEPGGGEANTLFRRYCQSCHGADGNGDPRGAVKGVPDFIRAAWQQRRSDAQLMVAIREGKSSAIPPFNNRLREAQIKALVAHPCGFAPERPEPAPARPVGEEAPVTDFEARFRQVENELKELKSQIKALDSSPLQREKMSAAGSESQRKRGKPPRWASHHHLSDQSLLPESTLIRGKRSRTEGDDCVLPARCLRRGGPLPIRCPPAANLVGPEIRSNGTPFSASEGQLCGGNDQEGTRRVFLYSFQAFTGPALSEVGQDSVVSACSWRGHRGLRRHWAGAIVMLFGPRRGHRSGPVHENRGLLP
jgi:mono/diheme cytochrome c family protein